MTCAINTHHSLSTVDVPCTKCKTSLGILIRAYATLCTPQSSRRCRKRQTVPPTSSTVQPKIAVGVPGSAAGGCGWGTDAPSPPGGAPTRPGPGLPIPPPLGCPAAPPGAAGECVRGPPDRILGRAHSRQSRQHPMNNRYTTGRSGMHPKRDLPDTPLMHVVAECLLTAVDQNMLFKAFVFDGQSASRRKPRTYIPEYGLAAYLSKIPHA